MEKILNKYGIEPQKTVHEDEAKQMFRDVLQNAPESSTRFIIIITCLYNVRFNSDCLSATSIIPTTLLATADSHTHLALRRLDDPPSKLSSYNMRLFGYIVRLHILNEYVLIALRLAEIVDVLLCSCLRIFYL